jgi:hypothetical protein
LYIVKLDIEGLDSEIMQKIAGLHWDIVISPTLQVLITWELLIASSSRLHPENIFYSTAVRRDCSPEDQLTS